MERGGELTYFGLLVIFIFINAVLYDRNDIGPLLIFNFSVIIVLLFAIVDKQFGIMKTRRKSSSHQRYKLTKMDPEADNSEGLEGDDK